MISTLSNADWLNGVVYDEPTRVHFIDGRRAPSVTQVLKVAGLVEFPEAAQKHLARKASIGTAVHAAAHYADEGDLDRSTVADEAESRLRAWEWFKELRKPSIILLETAIASRRYHFIGRLDRLLYCGGRLVLLDLKTGKPQRADLQTAAYQLALREQFPELLACDIDRWSVVLKPNGRYSVDVYRDDKQNRREFLAAVAKVHELTSLQGGTPCWE